MTDEIYRCNGCGKTECDGHSEFLIRGIWYHEDKLSDVLFDTHEIDEERYICPETGEPETKTLVYSTEWERD